jgi:hypothetical protein
MCHRDDCLPLNDRLVALIKEACLLDPSSKDPRVRYQRRRTLNCLVMLMQRSGRLWRGGGSVEPGDLAEAESRTWLYFCQHLQDYNASQGTVINWYNNILKWRIKDVWREKQLYWKWFAPLILDEDGQPISAHDPAAPPECPDILAHIHQLLEDNRAEFEAIHMRDRPDINAYVLIRARLPDQYIAWADLAKQFNVSLSSLSGFYQKKCWPLLQKFGEEHGYLDPDQ